jgi:hypothetical protein
MYGATLALAGLIQIQKRNNPTCGDSCRVCRYYIAKQLQEWINKQPLFLPDAVDGWDRDWDT